MEKKWPANDCQQKIICTELKTYYNY